MPIKSDFPPVPLPTGPYTEEWLAAVWSHSQRCPDKIAAINAHDPSDRLLYRDLFLYSHSLAAFLQSRHFGARDMAGSVLSNGWEFLVVFGGVTLQGGCLSPASYQFTEYELERQFIDAKCKLLFVSESALSKVLKVVNRCPMIELIIVVREDKSKPLGELPFGCVPFELALTAQPDFANRSSGLDIEKDLILLPYSSGTTGPPKGVMLSHLSYSTIMRISHEHYPLRLWSKMNPPLDLDSNNVLMFLPFYHIYGIGVLTNTIFAGSTCVIMNKFEPELFLQCIEKYKVRIQYLVPPILLFLAKHPLVDKYDVSSLELVLSGAAPAGKDICDEVSRRLPNIKIICQAYGMSELCIASHFPIQDGRDGNVGKLIANLEMKIVDIETGEEKGVGESGEICVRGPTVMIGYLNRPEATRETIQNDGFLHTGDIGYVDSNGFLYVIDRLKELIKVNGLQVPPAELEDLLLSNPKIADCAVIGIPDAKSGERPKAFIVRRDKTLSAEEIRRFVNSKVAPYKQINIIDFVSEIPKSPSGKILRRMLRDQTSKL